MKSPFNHLFIALLSTLLACNMTLYAQVRDTLNLEGAWEFRKDADDIGRQAQWYRMSFDDHINLPGSMREQGKGDPVTLATQWTGSIYDSSFYYHPRLAKYRGSEPKFPFWLTPRQQYVGAAWYSKEVVIPKHWKNKQIYLLLERVHTESTLWVDGRAVGMQNSLVAPHYYELTQALTPGTHRITLCIDNRIKDINVGPDSHSITDHTQGNWNGIIGQIKLIALPEVAIEGIQAYPDVERHTMQFKIAIRALKAGDHKGSLNIAGFTQNTDLPAQEVAEQAFTYHFHGREDTIVVSANLGKDIYLWNAFQPSLYHFHVQLQERKTSDALELVTGIRDVHTQGRQIVLNDVPVFLRGTVDNAVFPLTGYPNMQEAFWVDVFRKIRLYGLNHVRFHSWCPPMAAFRAADQVGIYLQPEGPSWANHGSALGMGDPIDQYIYDETIRMERYYGNAPSYLMMAYGNEPRGRQVPYLEKFNAFWMKRDPRRLYAGASVGGSWPVVPNNQVMVRGGARDLDWKRHAPQTMQNFTEAIKAFKVPFVAHEMGQYCVYPDFNEIAKYQGVYEARNFEMFREDLDDHFMLDQAEAFVMASGFLQMRMYKYTIEKALRTPEYAGFQLLSLNDYPGQGSAIVGVLDAFWDEKPYVKASEFRQFCNDIVPLAEFSGFVFTDEDTISVGVGVSNYSDEQPTTTITWQVLNAAQQVVASGTTRDVQLDFGYQQLQQVAFIPPHVAIAQKFTFEVVLEGPYRNTWDFWVFPSKVAIPEAQFYVSDSLDKKAKEVLLQGGKVLLLAAGKIRKGEEVRQSFMPVFWNTSWFQMRPPHTLGMLVDDEHAALGKFPTEDHSDLQWWALVNNADVMNLEDFPASFRPIVQPIDTWFMNRRLASLWEAKVKSGKLIMTTLPLQSDARDPVIRQMYYSLVSYMNSEAFSPEAEVALSVIEQLFTTPSRQQFDQYSVDGPDELKPGPNK